MYIMAPEPISAAYFINPSQRSVCLFVYTPLSLPIKLLYLTPNSISTLPEGLAGNAWEPSKQQLIFPTPPPQLGSISHYPPSPKFYLTLSQ
jgi:hypothetical protein